MTTKDKKKFSIVEFLQNRPLSWSAINCFSDPQWGDPEKWYQTYILNKRQSSKELEFGSIIDKKIQDDLKFLPDLPRYPLMQHKLKVAFDKIHLVGLPDGLCLKSFFLADYKTGKIPWTQEKANETGQLTMYLFLIYITYKIPPEQFTCFIHWLPTQKEERGDFNDVISFRDNPVRVFSFKTKRTMTDLLYFGEKIKKVIGEMEMYVRNHA